MEKIDFVNATHPAINDTNLNKMQDNIETAINAQVSGDTLPIGAIIPWTTTIAPNQNWLVCNGQAVSRTTYSQLFNIIGTQYGEGDGSTTFNVPDLRGRHPMGYNLEDTDFNRIGKTGGEKTHAMTVDELVRHRHGITPRNTDQTGLYEIRATNATGTTGSAYTDYTGNGQPFNVLDPYLTTNYIIKAFQTAGVIAEVVNVRNNSQTKVYSTNYTNNMLKIFNVELTLGTFPAGGDKYDQVYAIPTTDIPSDYTPIAIAGTQLWGGYHSKVSFSYMYITERNIAWAANNNSSNATGSIGANVRVLAMKTS